MSSPGRHSPSLPVSGAAAARRASSRRAKGRPRLAASAATSSVFHAARATSRAGKPRPKELREPIEGVRGGIVSSVRGVPDACAAMVDPGGSEINELSPRSANGWRLVTHR